MNLSNIENNFFEVPRIEAGAIGLEARILPLFACWVLGLFKNVPSRLLFQTDTFENFADDGIRTAGLWFPKWQRSQRLHNFGERSHFT